MGTEAAPPEDDIEIDAETGAPIGHPVVAFLPRLAVWAVVLAVVEVGDTDPALSLLLIALAGVVTIVTDSRFAWERWLEEKGIPNREGWVPLVMLAIMAQLGLVDGDNIDHVITDKGPVIVFILAFALVAEGLRRSGFIHFLAYRLTERGGANTTRLTLYLFLLSSLLTYFTSNDIVVLTMTPIVVSVAYQARIRNAKMLLLSQFIAANTVSMGILIGSPTNLILGRAMNIRFFEYLFLMLAPSMMALMATFVLVTWANWFVRWRTMRTERGETNLVMDWLVGKWGYSPTYTQPRFSEYRSMNREMRRWVTVFGLSALMLMIGTATDRGLLVAAIAIGVVGVVSLRASARQRDEPTDRRFYGRLVRVLPLGIVFFGLTYFVIADAAADTRFVREDVDEYVTDHASSHTPVPSWGSMLVSGGLVNTMNDLPASALAGTVLHRAEFKTPFDRSLVVQGSLTGLNIATYVTPVGALAGIIWFDILRRERRRRREESVAAGQKPLDVILPRRRDLVIYGSSMFLAVTAILGATNFGFVSLADALLGPPTGGTEFGSAPGHILWTLGCVSVIVAVVVAFRVVLRRAGVALAHFGDVLVVLTQLRLWASRHRMLAAAWIAGLMFLASGALLYWSETFHAREYHRSALFKSPGEFVTWLTVFVSSGFENAKFPRSVLGHVLAALLALGSIGVLVVLVRLSTGSTDLTLRRKLGRGEIPSDRLVIVNCSVDNLGLVRTLVDASHRFVTIASRDPRLETRFGLRKNDRVDVFTYTDGAAALLDELRLGEARELVLLSRSVADDFDNLALLSALDARGVDPPAVVLQVHERELPVLLDSRLSARLRGAVVRPPFDQVVRSFLVADAAGRGAEGRGLYAEPLVARTPDPATDPYTRVRGVSFTPDGAAEAVDAADRQRSVVWVVGAGCFAQAAALELATSGVPDVRLLVTSDEALLPGVATAPGLAVERCASERHAAELLGVSASPDDEAILLLDGTGETGLDSERLLERLSLARLHDIDAGRPVPYLVVGCRGAEAARRNANFVVDRVVDVTWVEASYFTAFARVYFDVLLDDEELANWPATRQLAVADRLAAQVCHLDVATRGALRVEPVGTLRFEVEHVDGRAVAAIEAKIPSSDEPLAADHLLLGVFYN